MRIRVSEPLTVNLGTRHHYTATPEMGVIRHFPRDVCKALIKLGAEDLTPKKKTLKKVKAEPAE